MQRERTPGITTGFLMLLVFVFHFAIPFNVHSQAWEYIAPKPVPQKTPEFATPTPKAPELVEKDVVLLDSLQGLRFVTSVDQVPKLKDKPPVTSEDDRPFPIEAEGIPLLQTERFEKYIGFYFNRKVTLNSLNELVQDVVYYFKANDFPVVYVAVPEQEISGGIIYVMVIEGKVWNVVPEGNRWFPDRVLVEKVELEQGDAFRESQMRFDLDWVNLNPFREVNFILTPGPKVGTTNLVLRTTDRWPVRIFAGFEDSGNDITNDERWLTGFNWGDVLKTDTQLDYQYTTDKEWNLLHAWALSYSVQLPWRHIYTMFGNYSDVKADTEPDFTSQGFSWQASFRYTIPLGWYKEYKHEWHAGFDLKQSNNNLEFGGIDAGDSLTDILQFSSGYSGTLRDGGGVTSAGVELVWSPGDLTKNNTTGSFRGIRALADAEYFYGRVFINRLQKLFWEFSSAHRFEYQWSDANLLASEQFGLGGYATIRGYDEREANGDLGWLTSHEIRTPPISLLKFFDDNATDEMQILGFFDYGGVQNKFLIIGEQPHFEFMSVGPGIRYQIAPYVTFRFDYGWHLKQGVDTRHNHRMHVGVVISN